MSVTINLRNNTDWWVKVDGLDETIAPNTPLDDRTYQWVSTENKQIKFFSSQDCDGSPIMISTLNFEENVGIKVRRGDLGGAQVVLLDADSKGFRVIQEGNTVEEVLLVWEQIDSECVVNLNYNK